MRHVRTLFKYGRRESSNLLTSKYTVVARDKKAAHRETV